MIYGEGICCSVVFGTMVGVSVFSGIWPELLMTLAISCPLWSSVYECQRVECAFTFPVMTECGMFVMCCMQLCMSVSTVLYVRVSAVFVPSYLAHPIPSSIIIKKHMHLCFFGPTLTHIIIIFLLNFSPAANLP